MSVLILNKSISQQQWAALGILTAGVACVQISSIPTGGHNVRQTSIEKWGIGSNI